MPFSKIAIAPDQVIYAETPQARAIILKNDGPAVVYFAPGNEKISGGPDAGDFETEAPSIEPGEERAFVAESVRAFAQGVTLSSRGSTAVRVCYWK